MWSSPLTLVDTCDSLPLPEALCRWRPTVFLESFAMAVNITLIRSYYITEDQYGDIVPAYIRISRAGKPDEYRFDPDAPSRAHGSEISREQFEAGVAGRNFVLDQDSSRDATSDSKKWLAITVYSDYDSVTG